MKWEEPPPEGTGKHIGGGKWLFEATQLRKDPKRWARVAENLTYPQAGQLAENIRSGKLRNFRPPRSFEAVARLGRVYARYVGEE
jgi:hypothetical protein